MSQTHSIQFKIKKIIFKYNIASEEIEKVLEKIMIKKILEDSPIDDSGRILTYLHRTWGSCRVWKLIALKNENENGNEFVDGEWVDRSSSKNVFKYKLTDVEKLPREFTVYYFESPSCNQRKQFRFKVVVEVVR